MLSVRDRAAVLPARNVARVVKRAGDLVYPPVALLVFATAATCAFSLLSAPRFDAESVLILAVFVVVLSLSARLSHPVLRLVTAVAYLGVTGTVIGQMGVAGYLAELADPRDMGDPIRVFWFTAAQLVTTLLTVAARSISGR